MAVVRTEKQGWEREAGSSLVGHGKGLGSCSKWVGKPLKVWDGERTVS